MDKYAKRTGELKKLGFSNNRVGYTSQHYALTYLQIQDAPEKEWNEFIELLERDSSCICDPGVE